MERAACISCRSCPAGCAPGAGARCRVLIRRAGGSDEAAARAALSAFCERTWRPVYVLVRGQGYAAAEAEDLTQSYFTRFLERGYVHDARSWAGCFRPFLRVSVRHFLSNARDRERARKRGGGLRAVSLDSVEAHRAVPQVMDAATPETLLERRRLEEAIASACVRLGEEMRRAGRGPRLERLMEHLGGGGPGARSYRTTAREWGVSESAVRVAVHRLRRRLAGLLAEGAAAPRCLARS
jgi:RNA polymerase sigma-70 factor (ECF subfamily)